MRCDDTQSNEKRDHAKGIGTGHGHPRTGRRSVVRRVVRAVVHGTPPRRENDVGPRIVAARTSSSVPPRVAAAEAAASARRTVGPTRAPPAERAAHASAAVNGRRRVGKGGQRRKEEEGERQEERCDRPASSADAKGVFNPPDEFGECPFVAAIGGGSLGVYAPRRSPMNRSSQRRRSRERRRARARLEFQGARRWPGGISKAEGGDLKRATPAEKQGADNDCEQAGSAFHGEVSWALCRLF